jgi:zinc protease
VSLSERVEALVARLEKLPLVSVSVVLRGVGASAERPGNEGIAQQAAAMLLEGTASRDGAALAEEFESLGGTLVTVADWDSISASFTVHRDRLADAVRLAAEVLRSPAFREPDLARLKAEHEAARLQLMSDPRALADAAFARSCFGGGRSRYARPIDGTLEDMRRISAADAREFWQECLTSASWAVIAAGDTEREVVREAAELFTRDLARPSSAVTRGAAGHSGGQGLRVTLVAKEDAAQAELRIGHVGVPRLHPDFFPLTVMNAVLGGLFSSRINLNLRERHGYTYGAFSGFDWRVDAGAWAVSTAVKSEVTGAAVPEIIAEIERIRTTPIDATELNLATDYLVGVFPLRFETTAAVNGALASLAVYGLGTDYFDTYRDAMRRVTVDGVLAAARAHLHPADLHIVAVGNPDVLGPQLESIAKGPVEVRSPAQVEAAT